MQVLLVELSYWDGETITTWHFRSFSSVTFEKILAGHYKYCDNCWIIPGSVSTFRSVAASPSLPPTSDRAAGNSFDKCSDSTDPVQSCHKSGGKLIKFNWRQFLKSICQACNILNNSPLKRRKGWNISNGLIINGPSIPPPALPVLCNDPILQPLLICASSNLLVR